MNCENINTSTDGDDRMTPKRFLFFYCSLFFPEQDEDGSESGDSKEESGDESKEGSEEASSSNSSPARNEDDQEEEDEPNKNEKSKGNGKEERKEQEKDLTSTKNKKGKLFHGLKNFFFRLFIYSRILSNWQGKKNDAIELS